MASSFVSRISVFSIRSITKNRDPSRIITSFSSLRNIGSCKSLYNLYSHNILSPHNLCSKYYKTDCRFHKQLERNYANHVKKSSYIKRDAYTVLHDALKSLSLKQTYKSEDWDEIKQLALSRGRELNANEKNVETVIMKNLLPLNNLYLGRSYYLDLKNKCKTVNLITSGWYLRLNYSCWDDVKESDIVLVKTICDEIISKLPYVEITLIESLVLGLCVTDRWKQSLNVIDKIREVYDDIPGSAYNAIIAASFKNGDFDTGWKLVEDRSKTDWTPTETIYEVWLKVNKNSTVAVDKLLKYFSEYCVIPTDKFGSDLLRSMESNGDVKSSKIKSAMTVITERGFCKNCSSNLKSGELSAEEFELLRSSFLDPLIVGKNIFLKSTPEELDRFLKCLSETAPYDIVLDGLNIAYSVGMKKNNSKEFSQKLKTVVKYLADKNKKVLVLGRQHMKHWSAKDMGYIDKHSHLFLADDVSMDDPYILYATMYSGINAKFISRDMMRGHKYLLGLFDRKLISIFWRWQCQSQYFLVYILDNGQVILKSPVTYLQSPHQLEGQSRRWHVPCSSIVEPNTPGYKKFAMQNWLCIPAL